MNNIELFIDSDSVLFLIHWYTLPWPESVTCMLTAHILIHYSYYPVVGQNQMVCTYEIINPKLTASYRFMLDM